MAENEELAQQLAAAQLNEGGTNNDVEMESCSGTRGYNLWTRFCQILYEKIFVEKFFNKKNDMVVL